MLIDFEKLKPLLPYFNLLAIFLGIAKLILYYEAFGIHIVQYIDLSEALVLFFEDILLFIFFVFLPFVVVTILVGHKLADIGTSVSNTAIQQSGFLKRLLTFMLYNSPFILFILIGISKGKIELLFIVIVAVTYILLELDVLLKKRYGKDLDVTYRNLIFWLAMVIYLGYTQLKNQVMEARDASIFENSSILLKEKGPLLIDTSPIFW